MNISLRRAVVALLGLASSCAFAFGAGCGDERAAPVVSGSAPARAQVAFVRVGEELRAADLTTDYAARLDAKGRAELSAPGWSLSVRWAGLGREGEVAEVAAPDLEVTQSRAIYRHGAAATQWFAKADGALEQGFTLATPPTAVDGRPLVADGRPLVIELAIEGDLTPFSARRGGGVELRDASGVRRLRYVGLHAEDATGRALRSHMVVKGQTIRCVVDDAGAVYPVTVDPMFWTSQATIVAASPQDWDSLGIAVALSGDTLAVGAPQNNYDTFTNGPGYVLFYQRVAGSWALQQTLSGSGTQGFGYAIAMDGARTAISSYDCSKNTGSAQVFVQSGGVWALEDTLVPSNPLDVPTYTAVTMDGDTVAFSTIYNAGMGDNGVVYVFVRNGANWVQQARLTPPDSIVNDRFGQALDMSGDTLLIGAYGQDDLGAYSGAAYVYTRSGAAWTLQQKLLPSVGGPSDFFGRAVTVDVNTAVVNSFGYGPGANNVGAAFVFERSGGVWTETQMLTPAMPVYQESFGASIDIEGNVLIVGAPVGEGSVDPGRVYVYDRIGGVFTQSEVIPNPPSAWDFGFDVSLSGLTVGIGSIEYPGGNVYQGAAYVYAFDPLNLGEPCQADLQCSSGHCIDGVCCDTACGGGADDCQGCTLATGSSADGTCTPYSSSTLCRASTGPCDPAENCDGAAGVCPDDVILPAGSVCHTPTGPCDAPEACDGVTGVCPKDDLFPSGHECRAAVGACDAPETCDGATDACPSDALVAAGTACRPAKGDCDREETCSGDDPACPFDDVKFDSTSCDDGNPCTENDQCMAGVCVGEPRCDSSGGGRPSTRDTGCGCRQAGGAPAPSGEGALTLLMALFALGRRRDRA